MMKRLFLLAAALSGLCTAALADNIRFASHPSLSPDGKQIYFSYDGDIFSVPATGGQATAVITMPGVQDSPLVSPDGKWLAFSSDIQGNNDIYAVPVAGGQAVQLTFHESPDIPISWSADSRYIYFESTRASARKTTFRVTVAGGTPQLMFEGFFNTVVNLAENPKTGEFLFNESMESLSFPTRKRYVGDHNPNIKSWNPKTRTYTELTDYIGKDQWPMADRNGNIYYVSDELNKESNIVKYVKGGKPVQLTAFDQSVQYPSIAFPGSRPGQRTGPHPADRHRLRQRTGPALFRGTDPDRRGRISGRKEVRPGHPRRTLHFRYEMQVSPEARHPFR